MPILLFVLIFAGALALAVTTQGQASKALGHPSQVRSYSKEPPPDLFSSEYDLLDTVLAASVDGKFHALSRSSGHTLWSMSSFATTTSVSAPASLAPLVRTPHTSFVEEETDDHETYIIEPQSGEIYVLADPASPLQRFPFSVQELVDMSPFTSSNAEHTRVFVGRKETSLLLIELETGKIKATLNSECPPEWEDGKKDEIDLDDLGAENDTISSPAQVYIGRTGAQFVICPNSILLYLLY
jgi:serine/threonine-protein kinase/endoribonuclease IRE1